MPNLFKILNIANLALSAQQSAVAVAAHNIANVNTDGFNRQKIIFEANTPESSELGFLGTGVGVARIERVQDRFLGIRINTEIEIFGELDQKSKVLEQLEIIFNESGDLGLNKTISDFFDSWRFLASNATLDSARTDLLNKASDMVARFNKMDSDLRRLRGDTDTKIVGLVTDINSITSQIAVLNDQIHQVELGNTKANDLRDRREVLLKELSQKISIDFFENANNIVNVVTTNGFSLVENLTAFTLSTVTSATDASVRNVQWQDQSGNLVDITSVVNGGELAGLVEMRDSVIPDFSSKLGRVAAGIVNEINKLHFAGYGLDGSTGINFFTPLGISISPGSSNTGSASATGSVADTSALLRDDYEITITSATTFTLQNITRNSASGTFTFSTGTAALISQGMSVTITGTAATSDVFGISPNKDAAQSISITSTVLNNSNRVAASVSGERDDGENSQAIADLESTFLMSPGTAGTFTFTIQDFYSAVVSEVGSDTKSVKDNFVQQEGILNQLENLKEAVSGVSIDEEMLNIIKFQRAYEAAAKLIAVVDDMLDILISIV